MKRLSSNEIKEEELKILLYFNRFCKENQLKYYLAGGTLLGAIRHKGFIPWDDDIDICMPRKDYVKLIKKFNSDNQTEYIIKSNINNTLDVPFSKIINIKTNIVPKYTTNNVDAHLWIDIFPIDGLPDSMKEVESIYNLVAYYRRILGLASARLGEGTTLLRKYSKFFLKPIARLYGKKRCIDAIETIARKYPYDESKYVGAITWGLYGTGERMLKSEFEKAVEVDFEGHKFPAFSCWDSYLKGLYGDYMQLPPVEKRRTHEIIVDLIEG